MEVCIQTFMVSKHIQTPHGLKAVQMRANYYVMTYFRLSPTFTCFHIFKFGFTRTRMAYPAHLFLPVCFVCLYWPEDCLLLVHTSTLIRTSVGWWGRGNHLLHNLVIGPEMSVSEGFFSPKERVNPHKKHLSFGLSNRHYMDFSLDSKISCITSVFYKLTFGVHLFGWSQFHSIS